MIIGKKQLLLIICSCAVITFLFTFFLFLYHPKTVIGFYRIPEQSKNALSDFVQKELNAACKFIDIDSSKSLNSQERLIKKIDILFMTNSIESLQFPPFSIKTSNELKTAERAMPSPIRSVGTVKKANVISRYALPVLLNHFEIAYNKNMFGKNKIPFPLSFDLIEPSAKLLPQKLQSPITVAGGEDDTLITFIGAITEALYGPDSWNALAQLLCSNMKTTDDENKFFQLCKLPIDKDGTTLDDVLEITAKWETLGLLHSQWKSLTTVDTRAFMETEQTAIVFMPTSIHRTLEHRVAENYIAAFIPCMKSARTHQLTIPTIVACFPHKKPTDEAVKLLSKIGEIKTQESLCLMSGLAPVHAQAETADRQASDIRVWAAASGILLTTLDDATCSTPQEKEFLAHMIRNRIAALKVEIINTL